MSPVVVVAYVASVVLLAIVARGMGATYRGRRHDYYTLGRTLSLIVGFAAVGAALLVNGSTGPGRAAVALAAWISLEGVFHLVHNRRGDDATQ